MATGDIYRLAIRAEHVTTLDDAVIVLHFKALEDTIFDTQTEDLVQAARGEFETDIANAMSVNYHIKSYNVRQITGGAEVFELNVDVAGTRGSSGGQLPPQVAAVISWRTGQAGRSKRGRSYMMPADEGDTASGRLESTYKAAVTNIKNNILGMADHGGVLYANYQLVVWSRVQLQATDVILGIVRDDWYVQRRRGFGKGA